MRPGRKRPHDQALPVKPLPAGARILIVEDNEELRKMVARIFADFDCEVVLAATAGSAVDSAVERPPDLVVMDFELPDFNGFELIRQLREVEALAGVPIVMLTGSARAFGLAESLEWEVSALLRKPARTVDILDAVNSALGGRLPPKAASGDPSASLPDVIGGSAAAEGFHEILDQTTKVSTLIQPEEDARGDVHTASEADAAPVIRFVDAVLGLAVSKKASDIHIEPQEKVIRVRFRMDGHMVQQLEAPIAMSPAVSARLKIMSNLNISERRIPQDGRFKMRLGDGNTLEVRLSTVPSKYGEKIVMRVLGQSLISGDLTTLKMHPRDLQCLEAAIANPNGLILVTGPTGSGKTTTLYTVISSLNTPGRNILTVEDPIEYDVPGLTQVATRHEVGFTFEKALRAFLRQDPDIILVGEIRDAETAEIALKAAATGHIVFSTLHTNDAASTLARLINMGAPPYMVAAAVRLVVAQRLVRVLCPKCKVPLKPTDAQLRILRPEEAARLSSVFGPVGCPDCNGLGYRGRAPVMEVLPVKSAAMRGLIMAGCIPDDLSALALKEGLRPLRLGALALVEEGKTSLPEAFKILVSD